MKWKSFEIYQKNHIYQEALDSGLWASGQYFLKASYKPLQRSSEEWEQHLFSATVHRNLSRTNPFAEWKSMPLAPSELNDKQKVREGFVQVLQVYPISFLSTSALVHCYK